MTAAQQERRPKPKPDMTTVKPHVAAPAAAAFDTTTPIDVSILPFTALQLSTWGPWFLSRLQESWPHLSAMNYLGVILPHMQSNGSLLLCARRAVILAVSSRETFEPRPIVDIVFAYKFHPDEEDENKDVRLLLRRVDQWARGQGARYVKILHPDRLDMTLSRTKEAVWAEDVNILLKDLDK